MSIQDAVMGTDNPRDLLLAAGVQAFRLQAGYVAPVLTEDDGLPLVRFWQTDLRYAWSLKRNQVYIGEMMVIWCETRLCYTCGDQLEAMFAPHVRIYTLLDEGEKCECCGDVFKTDVPF